MQKKYLLAPGPTPVPERVLAEMSLPIIHHRAPEYSVVLQEVRDNLKYLFQTKNEVLIFTSSGTGAMEGCVSNLLSKGDRAIAVRGGKFGERWFDICKAYSVNVQALDVEWGHAVSPKAIEDALNNDPEIKAVYIQASETSTGVYHPVKEIAEIIKKRPNTILVVDAITALGVVNIPQDEWGIDVVVTGSQKALMLPPGLAFASLSEKAWSFVEQSDLPKYYFNFKKEKKSLEKNQNAYTPNVQLIVGLREVLKEIKEEGLEHVFKRHASLANATKKAVQALGLKLYPVDEPSNALTAVWAPEGIDASKITKQLREKYGITIAGGQDAVKGKIFRIAHLGYAGCFDVITVISALEAVLKELGYKFESGAGLKAAQEALFGA
jgi:aspartate aminotransferase-like enzyme